MDIATQKKVIAAEARFFLYAIIGIAVLSPFGRLVIGPWPPRPNMNELMMYAYAMAIVAIFALHAFLLVAVLSSIAMKLIGVFTVKSHDARQRYP